eukprot:TRINITY_DN76491_c0_g1_i1.p1 TRINITY_DN76491_c0_g1~~TRINITY_DN76491_c0_g1_i1.p1  ORF type:complete len:103 (-),score=11.89 TRINITY_DN76491_c0_g1_i1:45-353(-)
MRALAARVNMCNHLCLCTLQLFNYTNLNQTWKDLGGPSDSFKGLAVLDFESWRAIYVTNFGSMTRYKEKSVELVRRLHPQYSRDMLVKTAEREWEEAARYVQ